MWVLILTLQYFVFIAVWNIRYPNITRFMLYELRKISLGEFFDDLELSKTIPEFFGIEAKESKATEEKVGEERLGSADSVLFNFGPTLLLGTILFLVVIIASLTIYIVC